MADVSPTAGWLAVRYDLSSLGIHGFLLLWTFVRWRQSSPNRSLDAIDFFCGRSLRRFRRMQFFFFFFYWGGGLLDDSESLDPWAGFLNQSQVQYLIPSSPSILAGGGSSWFAWYEFWFLGWVVDGMIGSTTVGLDRRPNRFEITRSLMTLARDLSGMAESWAEI